MRPLPTGRHAYCMTPNFSKIPIGFIGHAARVVASEITEIDELDGRKLANVF